MSTVRLTLINTFCCVAWNGGVPWHSGAAALCTHQCVLARPSRAEAGALTLHPPNAGDATNNAPKVQGGLNGNVWVVGGVMGGGGSHAPSLSQGREHVPAVQFQPHNPLGRSSQPNFLVDSAGISLTLMSRSTWVRAENINLGATINKAPAYRKRVFGLRGKAIPRDDRRQLKHGLFISCCLFCPANRYASHLGVLHRRLYLIRYGRGGKHYLVVLQSSGVEGPAQEELGYHAAQRPHVDGLTKGQA